MDIQTIFEKFLENTVNLNKGRVERIEDAQRILTDFIKSCEDFKNLYIDTIPQGSFRQKTIIKPVGNSGTFDIDLLIKLKENFDWTASNYHARLAKAFKDSGTYEDITDTNGKTRCVTIDYKEISTLILCQEWSAKVGYLSAIKIRTSLRQRMEMDTHNGLNSKMSWQTDTLYRL